jgi:hypothetical protein
MRARQRAGGYRFNKDSCSRPELPSLIIIITFDQFDLPRTWPENVRLYQHHELLDF